MTTTDWIILAIIAAIAASDAVLMARGLPTYSRRLRDWGARISFLPYAWGVLGGHFWSPLGPAVDWWAALAVLPVIGLILCGVHHFMLEIDRQMAGWLPLLAYFPIGVLAGAVLWAQGG